MTDAQNTHTPGPWMVHITDDQAHPHILQDDQRRPSKVIAIVFDDDHTTRPANAALLAAAPELLLALQNTVARMEENRPAPAKKRDLDAVFRVATFYRDLEEARRAIAKVQYAMASTPDDPRLHHDPTPLSKPLTHIELGDFPLHIPG
mgnify:CR=1 FL=1